MELFEFIKYGTPVLLLGMMGMLERLNGKVNNIMEDITEIKEGKTWKNECSIRHADIERRINSMEGRYENRNPH